MLCPTGYTKPAGDDPNGTAAVCTHAPRLQCGRVERARRVPLDTREPRATTRLAERRSAICAPMTTT